MSIQPGRVVFRIVDEVAGSPGVPLAVEWAAAHTPAGPAWVETARVARTPERSAAYPTLFHFWTRALRAFLERSGQADQLAGIAGFAMCQRLSLRALEHQLASECLGLTDPAAVLPRGLPLDAYRMIEGTCRSSLVVETEREWWALLRSHGPRMPLHCPT